MPISPNLAADGTVSGGLIDIGEEEESNNSIVYSRQIAFNGTVDDAGRP